MILWNKIKNTLGQTGIFAFASLFLCALSGVFLAIPYDVSEPYQSVSRMFWESKEALFTRSFHYWSAQFFLIFTILHFIDYYIKTKFRGINKGIWLRLVILVPVLFYLMLSGFLLKGDVESNSARAIFESLIMSIPILGESLSFLMLGPESNFQLIYVHHIGTGFIITWLFTIEHGKNIYPSFWGIIKVFPFLIILSFLFIPDVHDPNDMIVKSPWYLVGTQELLHWLSSPVIIILVLVIVLISIYSINHQSLLISKISEKAVKVFILIYLLFSITGYFFRFDYWSFGFPWDNLDRIEVPYTFGFSNYFFADFDDSKKVKFISGKPELCLSCHSDVKGLVPAHSPELIGCSSCHLGNSFSPNKKLAHNGMVLIPGNLENIELTCGRPGCHSEIVPRIENNLMNTMSGIVSVNKYVHGEIDNPDKYYHISDIGFSPAEKHLRNLCASCHLGQNKDDTGPITELSRGGGCLACHLNYGQNSLHELRNKNSKNKLHNYHPEVSLKIGNKHCFGCHSRSGRISTNYEGWYETNLDKSQVVNSNYRILEDERVFEKHKADLHFDIGMECIDCHSSYGVMGDGKKYFHEEDAVKIKCIDCHNTIYKTKIFDSLDIESQKIIGARGLYKEGRKFVIAESGYPVINVFIDKDSSAKLRLKNSEKSFVLKPFTESCGRDIIGHSKLSCSSCHTSRVYRCISCHTQYESDLSAWDHLLKKDVPGSWHESNASISFGAPTLAVRKKENGNYEVINTAPGMIMTLKKINTKSNSFIRLYAPIEPHSTQKASKTCIDCHLDPSVIGYGEGQLKYNMYDGYGTFEFIKKYNVSVYDGLPADAWIGFLKEPSGKLSTRSNIKPFNISEQQNILTVGSCFKCHNQEDIKLRKIFRDSKNYIEYVSKKCILPKYNIN